MSKGDVALELGRQIVERTKTNPPLNRDYKQKYIKIIQK